MVYLTWNMAKNIRVCDPELFIAMKTTLMCSLRQSVLMRQYALENDIPIRYICQEEINNICKVLRLWCVDRIHYA